MKLRSNYKNLRRPFRDVVHMYLTKATIDLYRSWFLSLLNRKSILNDYSPRAESLRESLNNLDITSPWFYTHIEFWLYSIEKFDLKNKPISILEIGSWEGLSTYFMLDQMQHSVVTSVDTWGGADEHKDGSATSRDSIIYVEDRFDRNLAPHKTRLTKFKGESIKFWALADENNKYDLIYIDGSHHVDDVLLDASRGFKLLKNSGIMIFDDYYFRYYQRRDCNPAYAINTFLRAHRGEYKILLFTQQLWIKKV